MTLWWLEPGWRDAGCALCGQNIYASGGDPDWGMCYPCFSAHLNAQEAERLAADEANYLATLDPYEPPIVRSCSMTASDVEALTQAAHDVLAERQRQISVEGLTSEHDDMNDRGELAQAAACYALFGTPADEAVFIHGRWKDPRDLFWPHSWGKEWWKPSDRRRDLVKAGALILAEIERMDRAALTQTDRMGEGA